MRKRLIEKSKKDALQQRQINNGTGHWQPDLNRTQQQQTEKEDLEEKSPSNQQHFQTNKINSEREQQQQQQCRVVSNETQKQAKTRDEAEVQRLVGKYDIATYLYVILNILI